MKFTYYFIALTIMLTIGCQKDSEVPDQTINYDCEFIEKEESTDGLLDETERSIIMECRETKLTAKSAIESNLIGEWELVGFADGWYSNVTQPCGYIKITQDQLIFDFENEYLDTVSIHTWEIENTWLKVDPPNKHLSMNIFCNQFMHGSYSDFGVYTIDVDQYIYEKVK